MYKPMQIRQLKQSECQTNHVPQQLQIEDVSVSQLHVANANPQMEHLVCSTKISLELIILFFHLCYILLKKREKKDPVPDLGYGSSDHCLEAPKRPWGSNIKYNLLTYFSKSNFNSNFILYPIGESLVSTDYLKSDTLSRANRLKQACQIPRLDNFKR